MKQSGRHRPAYHLLEAIARQVLELDPHSRDFLVRLSNMKASASAALQDRTYAKEGNPRIEHAREISIAKRKEQAEKYRQEMGPVLARLREEGFTTYSELAKALNDRGIKPKKAKVWNKANVHALERPRE